MTIRSTNDPGRKTPKVTKLVLNRETVQELTTNEAEAVGGMMQVFKPRKPPTERATCRQGCPFTNQGCPAFTEGPGCLEHEPIHQ
jgi:hypothetical protein